MKIRVRMNAIPIFPEPGWIRELIPIHLLGLIGLGSFQIACQLEEGEALMGALRTKAWRRPALDNARGGWAGVDRNKKPRTEKKITPLNSDPK